MYMELSTERLLLRPLDNSDLQTVFEYVSDVENTRYMMYYPLKSIEETHGFLAGVTAEWKKENPSFYEFAILYNSVHIGAVFIYLNEDGTEGELGWILSKTYWGKGFATEAALAIKSFAIQQIKVKKLVAHCNCRNLSSVRVMEKIGLLFENKGERKYPDERGFANEFKYSCDV